MMVVKQGGTYRISYEVIEVSTRYLEGMANGWTVAE